MEEFKATKARAVGTLLPSKDENVQQANKSIGCSRKWKSQEAVLEPEAYWKPQEIISVVCEGRLGAEAAEDDCRVKAMGLASPGFWMQWDQALAGLMSWKELLTMHHG